MNNQNNSYVRNQFHSFPAISSKTFNDAFNPMSNPQLHNLERNSYEVATSVSAVPNSSSCRTPRTNTNSIQQNQREQEESSLVDNSHPPPHFRSCSRNNYGSPISHGNSDSFHMHPTILTPTQNQPPRCFTPTFMAPHPSSFSQETQSMGALVIPPPVNSYQVPSFIPFRSLDGSSTSFYRFPPPPTHLQEHPVMHTPLPQPTVANVPFPNSKLDLFLSATRPFAPLHASSMDTHSYVQTDSKNQKTFMLDKFLQKFHCFNFKKTQKTSLPEFRSALRLGLSLLQMLQQKKSTLSKFLNSSEEEWVMEKHLCVELQKKLSSLFATVITPSSLNEVHSKLKRITSRRAVLRKRKAVSVSAKAEREEGRKHLHGIIDKWLDGRKEKDEKTHREKEMQAEADNILGEVRKKIYEAKRTLEKIKVFEKLRAARLFNAQQKGLFASSVHGTQFEARISALRSLVLARVSDYQGEERALLVMLETEREGRREEEEAWRTERARAAQRRRQSNVLRALFGNTAEPAPDDPLYLFYQHQNSGNDSHNSLARIRQHWDAHLHAEGEPVPLRWVVPAAPSAPAWKDLCENPV